ncbi:MAG: CTP-dependent riboflavin kinase [Candidatus Bathyarchaeota archaeon]|nr:CTP-dependent riboflavin kinase [Candidatus Bathyarchaeota archaeon]
MNSVTFEGKIITGKGDGKKYLSLPWVKRQVEEKLGFTPYLGTLNLQLTKESITRKKLLEEAETDAISPARGYCVGLLFEASVKGIKCAVVAPQIENYPKGVLELIAPVNLREALKVKDGDSVTVSVCI